MQKIKMQPLDKNRKQANANIEKKLKEKYSKDSFFIETYRKLDVSDMAFIDVVEVIESQRLCLNCLDLSECKQTITGYYLTIDNKEILNYPCSYQRERANLLKYLKFSTFDFIEQLPSIQDIDTNSQVRIEITSAILDIIDNYTKKGVYLYGPAGVGKTYLLKVLLNAFLSNQKECAYILLNDLDNLLKPLYFRNDMNSQKEFHKIIDILKRVKLLIIDDIGTENNSAFLRDDVLFPILDYRMNNNLLTCFSSNYTFEELDAHYEATNASTNEPVKAKKLIERIRVLSNFYYIDEEKSRRI